MPPKPQPEPVEAPHYIGRGHDEETARHGGAWKVAYADFVTALLALFIVLWLMTASSRVKQSVAGYFHDPRGYAKTLGAGPAGSGEGLLVQERNVGDVKAALEQAMRQMPELKKIKDNVGFSVTGEGLRIDLLETEQGLFFVTGQPGPTPAGERLLGLLAEQISKIPNSVVIEGHTDAQPFRDAAPLAGYTNWELSTDRANTARRLLMANGVSPEKIAEVRGFADKKLFRPGNPQDPRNRRVSVVVKFEPGAGAEAPKAASARQ